MLIPFYRVEDERGIGPYQHPSKFLLKDDVVNYAIHVLPSEDSLLCSNLHKHKTDRFMVKYGFNKIEQFKQWFYSYDMILAMHEKSYHMSVYKIAEEDLIIGNTQCVVSDAALTKHMIEYKKSLLDFVPPIEESRHKLSHSTILR